MGTRELDYNEYIEIAEGTYWVGFADKTAGLHCNPYLIVDGDEAVLIDSGSRNDFSTVMLKIMRTGTNPGYIKRLIYHHYDPDLCGNIPHMEALIASKELKIISHRENNVFINYYATKSPMQCIETLDLNYEFKSGRILDFIHTPYSHSPGSFMTYDEKTKILFSSDIFGSFDTNWSLYTQISERCADCTEAGICPYTKRECQITGILNFHRRLMTSQKALQYALSKVKELGLSMIVPQHGSIINTPDSIRILIDRLYKLDCVGIDNYLEEKGECVI